MTAPLCVVTGASGAVGPSVVERFRRAGYRVRTVSRHSSPGLSAEEHIAADICDGEKIKRALSGADVIVHMAALLHVNRPAAENVREYHRVNVGGTENVLSSAGPQARIVYMSSIAVYGYAASEGVLATEQTETRPDTVYGETKLRAEQLVLAAGGTALRLAAVYGAHVKGNYRRLLTAIDRRRFVAVGSGRNRRTVVHDRDVAEAALLAANHPGSRAGVFNVTDGAVHELREIVASIASALGKPIPRVHLPLAPIRLSAIVAERLCRLLRITPPVDLATIDKYVEEVLVSGQKAVDILAFSPAHDLRSGWIETIRAMREAGDL